MMPLCSSHRNTIDLIRRLLNVIDVVQEIRKEIHGLKSRAAVFSASMADLEEWQKPRFKTSVYMR